MYTNASQYVSNRDGVFYYIRRVPHDVRQHYASSRISFSLRTKSLRSAARTASSVSIWSLGDMGLGIAMTSFAHKASCYKYQNMNKYFRDNSEIY
jgi:hypothetical protein